MTHREIFVHIPQLGMWVDDTVPHEMPASYVKEIREDKSHDKGVKAQRPLLEMTSRREKGIQRETFNYFLTKYYSVHPDY